MEINDIILAFSNLKAHLTADNENFNQFVNSAINANGWFTKSNIIKTAKDISNGVLELDSLKQWVMENNINNSVKNKTIGIVSNDKTAFSVLNDIVIILLSGNKVKLKENKVDDVFYKYVLNALTQIDNRFSDLIEFSPILKNVDAFILNGFEDSEIIKKYFSKKPYLFRHKTTSLSILSGTETNKELQLIAYDVCSNFGLSCNNVSKLFVPNNWDPKPFLKAIEEGYDDIKHHHKYKNNYDYQLSLLLVNGVPHFATENLLLRESKDLFSSITCLYYQQYNSLNELNQYCAVNSKHIQNIYSNLNLDTIITQPFGSSNLQSLNNFPSNLSTTDFLKTLV